MIIIVALMLLAEQAKGVEPYSCHQNCDLGSNEFWWSNLFVSAYTTIHITL